MSVPDRWRKYQCKDYFEGGWDERGHFDEASQLLVIMPVERAYENAAIHFFAVGHSGTDGIDFGYRKGHSGLWAFYPIEGSFAFMAPTIADLVSGWCSGRLSV